MAASAKLMKADRVSVHISPVCANGAVFIEIVNPTRPIHFDCQFPRFFSIQDFHLNGHDQLWERRKELDVRSHQQQQHNHWLTNFVFVDLVTTQFVEFSFSAPLWSTRIPTFCLLQAKIENNCIRASQCRVLSVKTWTALELSAGSQEAVGRN